MERITALLLCLLIVFCFTGCSNPPSTSQIVATTLPVYNITQHLCDGTDLSVTRLITEDISCLHDYTLKVPQMRAIEGAETLIISGAGLESFLNDTGTGTAFVIDASRSIALICQDDHHADAEDPHHHHQEDPHIWLSP